MILHIGHTKTALIAEALSRYAEVTLLLADNETPTAENYLIKCDIAWELSQIFTEKSKQIIYPEKHLVSLKLHELIVLQASFKTFTSSERNDFRRRDIEEIEKHIKWQTEKEKTVTQ